MVARLSKTDSMKNTKAPFRFISLFINIVQRKLHRPHDGAFFERDDKKLG
jgi:hypothetical protein